MASSLSVSSSLHFLSVSSWLCRSLTILCCQVKLRKKPTNKENRCMNSGVMLLEQIHIEMHCILKLDKWSYNRFNTNDSSGISRAFMLSVLPFWAINLWNTREEDVSMVTAFCLFTSSFGLSVVVLTTERNIYHRGCKTNCVLSKF